MEDTLAVNPTDAFTNMAGLFQGSAQPVSPRISLRVKIAKMRAEQLREKREIDKATMPYVQQDIIESEQRQIDVQSKIDEALNALNAPAPTQQQGSNEAELYAAGIGGLLSGGNLPEVLNALARVSGARNEMEFDDKLRQYGLNRETVKVSLQQLLSNLEDEAGNEREMRRANAQAGFQAEQKQIERDDDWERMFAKADLDLAFLEEDQQFKKDLASIEAGGKSAKDLAAATEKLRTNLEQSITSFNTKVQQARTAFQGILPDDLSKAYKAERLALEGRLAASGFDDLPGLEPVMSRQTAAGRERDEDQKYRQDEAQYRRDRDKKEDERTFAKAKAEGWVTGTNWDDFEANPDYKAKDQRGKRIAELTKKIEEVQGKTQTLLTPVAVTSPDKATALEESRDRENKLWDSLREEWRLINLKRSIAPDGKPIAFADYLRENYPAYAEGLGRKVDPKFQLRGPIGGNVKVTPTQEEIDRVEGLRLIREHPEKAGAIRQAFKKQYKKDLR